MSFVLLTPLPVAPTIVAGSITGGGPLTYSFRGTGDSATSGLTLSHNAQNLLDVQWMETQFQSAPFLPIRRMGIQRIGVRARIRFTSTTFAANSYSALLWDFQAGQWVEVWTQDLPANSTVVFDRVGFVDNPSRFFDASGRLRLRFANAKALGKPNAPNASGSIYLNHLQVFLDAERVLPTIAKQKLNPVPGYAGIGIEPVNDITYVVQSAGVWSPLIFGLSAQASTAANATDRKAGDLFDFPSGAEPEASVLEFLWTVGATSDTGVTVLEFSTDGGTNWTPLVAFSGPIASAQSDLNRHFFTPPADLSRIRLRLRLENASTGGRDFSLYKPIIYHLLKSHKTIRLFLAGDPVVQGGIASGSYVNTKTWATDTGNSNTLVANSYVKGIDGAGNPRYAKRIDFQLFENNPFPPSLVRQINIFARIWNQSGVSQPLVIANAAGAEFASGSFNTITGQVLGTSIAATPNHLSLLHTSPSDFFSGGALRFLIQSPGALFLTQLPTSNWLTYIQYLYVELVVPAAGETDWPFGVDVRGRIIASRLARYVDPRPAFLHSETMNLAPGATVDFLFRRPTGRSFLLTDVHLWTNGAPSALRLSILRNGTELPPFRDVILQPVIERDGVMSKIFSNLNVYFDPSETVAVRVRNVGAGSVSARLTAVGFTWFWINEMHGWQFHDLGQPL